MNIQGEYSDYLKTIINTFAPVSADDLRGIVYNGTLYFIVNYGLLYEVPLHNIPSNITCTFFRMKDVPNSFNQGDDILIDYPEMFTDIANKILIINNTKYSQPIYIDTDVKNSPEFELLDSMRTDDGAIKFNVITNLNHKSFVTLSKKMFKMNKADALSLSVFQVDYDKLLYRFEIFKKKFNLNINLYLLTLDLYT